MSTDELSFAGVLRDLGELVSEQRLLNARLDKQGDLVRSLADRVLHLANSGEKNTEALLYVRQRLTEIYEQREFIRAGQEEILRKLAVLSNDVGHVETDVREATGAHRLLPREPEKRPVSELVGAFRELPMGLKVMLFVLAALVATHSEIATLLGWLFKSGG